MKQANQIRFIVSFKFRQPMTADDYQRLTDFVQQARQQPGCDEFMLMEDISDPEFFVLMELWACKDAHDGHIRAAYFREFVSFLTANTVHLNARILKHLEV